MSRSPSRLFFPLMIASVGALALTGIASAQQSVPGQDGHLSLWLSFIVHLGLTIVVGAVALAGFENWSTRTIDRIRTRPGVSFLAGLGLSILAIVVLVVLFLTVIGIIVAVPMAIVFTVLSVVGYSLVAVAIGVTLYDRVDRWVGLLIGALILSVLALIPFVEGIVSLVVGSIGIGSIALGYFE